MRIRRCKGVVPKKVHRPLPLQVKVIGNKDGSHFDRCIGKVYNVKKVILQEDMMLFILDVSKEVEFGSNIVSKIIEGVFKETRWSEREVKIML